MIKLGITGGIGSGKSYVANLLSKRGIPVYDTDLKAKRLMEESPEIRQDLIKLVGKEAYLADGKLNKAFLASYLFSAEEHTQAVNSIVHPRVKDDFDGWSKLQHPVQVVALESAILYESHFDTAVDFVIMVYAPLELRIKRAVSRDSSTEEKVRARIAAQMDDEEKRNRADFVILNDGIHALAAQLDKLIEYLKDRKE